MKAIIKKNYGGIKMMRSFSALVVTLFCTALIMSCKPTTKNEIQKWENNKKDFAEAVMKYPAFKAVLDAKMAAAQKIWDEALKIGKEEEKAKKMKEAGDKLNELLNQFTQIKYKSKGINDAIAKFNSKKLTKTEDKVRQKAKADAVKALADVEAKLAKAKPADEADAMKITKEAIGDLITAQGNLDRAIKSVEPKKAPAKKK